MYIIWTRAITKRKTQKATNWKTVCQIHRLQASARRLTKACFLLMSKCSNSLTILSERLRKIRMMIALSTLLRMSHFLIHTNYNIKDNHAIIRILIFRTSFNLKRTTKLIKTIKLVLLISINIHKMWQKVKYC